MGKSKHPFDFTKIRGHVYSLEYAEDKADYLADMFVRISAYMAEHPESQAILQPLSHVISIEMEHHRKHALADSQRGIRQPYYPRGHGRPRRDNITEDVVVEGRTPELIQQEENIEKQLLELSKRSKSKHDPDRLSYKEAAELLGLAHSTVQKYASQGKIPSHKTPTGGRFMYRKEILDWKDSRATSLAHEQEFLSADTEERRSKSFRPSRERKKEERKQNMKKWTSQEVAEAYKKMKKK